MSMARPATCLLGGLMQKNFIAKIFLPLPPSQTSKISVPSPSFFFYDMKIMGQPLVRNGKLDILGKQTSTIIGVYIIILRITHSPSPSSLHRRQYANSLYHLVPEIPFSATWMRASQVLGISGKKSSIWTSRVLLELCVLIISCFLAFSWKCLSYF